MLEDLALPGEGGGIELGVDVTAGGAFGELCNLRSSIPPKMEEMDIPPDGRCDEKDARSRSPANGDAVGGPRGADPGRDERLEGS